MQLGSVLWSAKIPDHLRWAAEVFSLPPAASHIRRVDPIGDRVARFVLPLELCEPQNRKSHAPDWVHAKKRKEVFACMLIQERPRVEPLPGRPFVRCVRFSSVEPDSFSDGFKTAVDVLCAPLPALTAKGRLRKRRNYQRLGFIRDDSPKCIDLHQHWEPAPPKRGFGLIEIFTGA